MHQKEVWGTREIKRDGVDEIRRDLREGFSRRVTKGIQTCDK